MAPANWGHGGVSEVPLAGQTQKTEDQGAEERWYGPGTPGDRGEWEHGQRIDTHGPGLRRVKEARDGLTKDESLVI